MIFFLILFIILSLVNVIVSTLKSIITIKGTTLQAACINAFSYGINTVIVVFTAGEFTGDYTTDLIIKICSSAVTNFVGVHISSWILRKLRRDRLWEIIATIPLDKEIISNITSVLKDVEVPFNMVDTFNKKETIFHIYSSTKQQSSSIKSVLNRYQAKYIVHEEVAHL